MWDRLPYLRALVAITVAHAAMLKPQMSPHLPPAEWHSGQAGVRQMGVTFSGPGGQIRKSLHPHAPRHLKYSHHIGSQQLSCECVTIPIL